MVVVDVYYLCCNVYKVVFFFQILNGELEMNTIYVCTSFFSYLWN